MKDAEDIMKKLIISGLLSCSLLFSGLISEQKAEASTVGQTATEIALSYVGVPYVYGGSTPSGFDCSGLVNYTYKQAGLTLPRTSGDLYNQGTPVSKSELKTGDLVFFATSGTSRVSHVGIYLNNNQFVHSATSSGVRVDSLNTNYWLNTYVGSKRIDQSANSYWKFTDGKWYFYENGEMKTSWVKDDGSWYYLAKDGAMQTSWLYWANNWYFLKNSGAMATGWVLTGGKWYYLYADGRMAKNTTVQGYVVGNDGAWIQ
jgi:glucan-binding YG repeat protein